MSCMAEVPHFVGCWRSLASHQDGQEIAGRLFKLQSFVSQNYSICDPKVTFLSLSRAPCHTHLWSPSKVPTSSSPEVRMKVVWGQTNVSPHSMFDQQNVFCERTWLDLFRCSES